MLCYDDHIVNFEFNMPVLKKMTPDWTDLKKKYIFMDLEKKIDVLFLYLRGSALVQLEQSQLHKASRINHVMERLNEPCVYLPRNRHVFTTSKCIFSPTATAG